MADKVLKKQSGRCLKWLQRVGELCTAASSSGSVVDPAAVISAQRAAVAATPGFLVLNGGVLAGCTPHGVLTVLQANGLLGPLTGETDHQVGDKQVVKTPVSSDDGPAAHRLLFYGPTLPFVLVRHRLAHECANSHDDGTSVTTLCVPPGKSWYTGECFVVRIPQSSALWREGSSRNAGCGFLFLVPCDFDALHVVFASKFQRHAVCLPPQRSSACPVTPTGPRALVCSAVREVPGLFCVSDFVTADEEEAILQEVLQHRGELKLEFLARRRVAHFNRRFIYGPNTLGDVGVDVNDEPRFYAWMRDRLNNTDPAVRIDGPYPVSPPGSCACDQLTINYYDYHDGQAPGIATHVDAHSPFADCVFLVSLGSYTIMDFCPSHAAADAAPPVPVYMAPRSLVIMSGEARYDWTHCISEKRTDIVNEYEEVLVRQDRVSLTWRRGRDGIHLKSTCPFPSMCDGA